jgi:glyoxylase-like metal-dependent hydrolase (beta-lactamase superfamily II)
MQLNEDLHMLALPIQRSDQTVYFNLSLILDATYGPTLVDTGLPGQLDAITTALAEAGVRVPDLKQIILTHQDIDHVGSLHDLVQASGARVLAHAVEAPYIDGGEPPRFARPEVLAQRRSYAPWPSASSPRRSTSGFRMARASTWRVACG